MANVMMCVFLLLLIAPHASGIIEVYTTELWERSALLIIVNMTVEPYTEFIALLLRELNRWSTDLWDIKLLSVQTSQDEEPPHWIVITLIGRDRDRTSILLRSDNLYLIGFNNSDGAWFATKGNAHLIPGSEELLDYSVSYSSMLGLDGGGGKYRIPKLALGERYFLDSISAFSNYPAPTRFNLGIAMAKIVIMTVEAARIKPVAERVNRYWTGTAYLSWRQTKYIVTWGKMSFMLLCTSEDLPWRSTVDPDDEVLQNGVVSVDDALDILGIALYPRLFNPDDHINSCKALKVSEVHK
ncbi:hypothetical protein ACP4OV_016267 [Aristida adscensionis]